MLEVAGRIQAVGDRAGLSQRGFSVVEAAGAHVGDGQAVQQTAHVVRPRPVAPGDARAQGLEVCHDLVPRPDWRVDLGQLEACIDGARIVLAVAACGQRDPFLRKRRGQVVTVQVVVGGGQHFEQAHLGIGIVAELLPQLVAAFLQQLQHVR